MVRHCRVATFSLIHFCLALAAWSVALADVCLIAAEPDKPAATAKSGDAYVRSRPDSWTFGTAAVEKTVRLSQGRLLLESFINKQTGRQMLSASREIDELSPRIAGATIDGGWRPQGASTRILKQGELQLDLRFSAGPLEVAKTYLIYPGTSVIREWYSCRNAGQSPLEIVNPEFLRVAARPGDRLDTLAFHWMTGARNEPGCWTLRTLRLAAGRPEAFDSYDPFPGQGGRPTRGDGVDARITLNDKQVWPEQGVRHCPGDRDAPVDLELSLDIAAGDRLAFVLGKHGTLSYDTTDFDPVIVYENGQRHVASQEFGSRQGERGWSYGCLEGGKWQSLPYYDPRQNRWTIDPANPDGTPFVSDRLQHPGERHEVCRLWTAPKAGRIKVTGSICNVGDSGLGRSAPTHKMGSEAYAPWLAMFDRQTRSGLVVGWDYMGHWASRFVSEDDGAVRGCLYLAGHRQTLAPGQSFTAPTAFTAVFRDDLDNAGNELLDWQYQYLWDYTREGWFPAVPMLGNWHKGTGWGEANVPWWGSGKTDIPSQFTKIFRMGDLIRYVGADLYHRDWGWWDRAGDWNGPDFGTSGRYLRKSGIGQIIYAFLYTVDPQSKLAQAHPDWLIGETLDMSKPEVVAHIQRQLDDFHARWGDFAWRNDSTPTAPRGRDDTALLAQDQNFRAIIRQFLDKYPRSSFQSVNGGGNEAGYDYVRLSGMFQFTDGGSIMPRRNYYASLLFPPDKLMDNGDQWRPDQFDAAKWRSLLSMALMITGDTWDKGKLEGLRELIDMYHYLVAQGVAGRWVRVYRPAVEGDDSTLYIQRLSRDRLRGLIVPARPSPGPVVLRPKGLLPDAEYLVTFHESTAEQRATGRELMERGIAVPKIAPGELVYLNLPLHPGSKRDRQPPGPPASAAKRPAENMSYLGIEVEWKPARDDNWISYYEILRDGQPIDKVAKGTYYFDHSAGADLAARYEIRAVDGSGNVSPAVEAVGGSAARAQVIDDADRAVKFSGNWRHDRGLQPAHAETIASSDEAGATVEVTVEGRRILWFSKLGDDCGKATVSIDDLPPEMIDTYCSDDVWGVCVFRKELPAGGKHVVRITVSGSRNARAKGNRVYFDGIRAEGVAP